MSKKKNTKRDTVLSSLRKVEKLEQDIDILRTLKDNEEDSLENLLRQGREFGGCYISFQTLVELIS